MFKKSVISPVMAVLYLAVSITGVFLFFHVHNGMIATLHEWGGMLFIAVGIVHLCKNWKLFISYLNRSKGMIAAGISAVFCFALIIAGTGEKQDRGGKRIKSDHFVSHEEGVHFHGDHD